MRVGNAAAVQQQNDLNGEILLCLHTVLADPRIVLEQPRGFFPLVQRLVEQAIAIAPLADTGIWEFRTLPRHYTFSRAMCWAAIDRGAQIAAHFGDKDDAARWRAIADAERAILMTRGFNTQLKCFTQALDGEHGDAANLLFPSIGLLDARDPRFISTLEDYEKRMTSDGLMQRYTNVDDFGQTTSAFTMCSFWWSEALALAGRIEEAIDVFDRVVAHANPLGLFSEDIEPGTGRLLGNFPQAYTHVGLIHAAMTIGELMDAARDGRVAGGRAEGNKLIVEVLRSESRGCRGHRSLCAARISTANYSRLLNPALFISVPPTETQARRPQRMLSPGHGDAVIACTMSC